jgi:hypothetical protein
MASKKNQKKQADGVGEQKNTGDAPAVGDNAVPAEPATAANASGQPVDPPLAYQANSDDVAGSADLPAAPPAEDVETRSRRAFFGRSGHLAVMAELLHRRINVAIPEVDVGDDVFVVKGSDETVVRVQVKSAAAEEQHDNLSFV